MFALKTEPGKYNGFGNLKVSCLLNKKTLKKNNVERLVLFFGSQTKPFGG